MVTFPCPRPVVGLGCRWGRRSRRNPLFPAGTAVSGRFGPSRGRDGPYHPETLRIRFAVRFLALGHPWVGIGGRRDRPGALGRARGGRGNRPRGGLGGPGRAARARETPRGAPVWTMGGPNGLGSAPWVWVRAVKYGDRAIRVLGCVGGAETAVKLPKRPREPNCCGVTAVMPTRYAPCSLRGRHRVPYGSLGRGQVAPCGLGVVACRFRGLPILRLGYCHPSECNAHGMKGGSHPSSKSAYYVVKG